MKVNTFFPALLLLVGSSTFNENGLTPLCHVSKERSFLFCDTTLAVRKDPYLISQSPQQDYSALTKTGVNSEPKFVAVGGKLSAGYRDEGLYRYGQITAYPNLIAHQMGLSSFKVPLFDPSFGNGTGYLILKKDGKYPTWERVSNNTAVIDKERFTLLKYPEIDVDNLSFPEGPIFIKSMPENYARIYPEQSKFISYYNRILTNEQEGEVNFLDLLESKAPDLCTFERHFDGFLGMAERPVNLRTNFLFNTLDENVIYQQFVRLQKVGTKLVLFTIPQVNELPYFHIFTIKELTRESSKPVYVRYKNNHINPIIADEATLLLPTEAVRKTFLGKSTKGLSADNPFSDEEVISYDEMQELVSGLPFYNEHYVRKAGKKLNIPVVDLENLYKVVLENKYTSDDGFVVNGSYPDGDFFSSDGKSPSEIGQAVIANETIKVINQFYKTNIPLINIGEFKKRLSGK